MAFEVAITDPSVQASIISAFGGIVAAAIAAIAAIAAATMPPAADIIED